MRHLLASTLLALCLAYGAPPALAHAQLVQATPKVGSTVSSSPSEIRLQFSEAVEPRFSQIDVVTDFGRKVATGQATIDPKDPTQLVLRLGVTLEPGTYHVNWRVLSVDTHRTKGSFTFEVRP